MLNPMATAYDGTYDRLTRTDAGERPHANLHHCMVGGRSVRWGINDHQVCHRMVSTLINSMIQAGLTIIACQASRTTDFMRQQHPAPFGGTFYRPDFIFFRVGKG